MNTEFKNLCEKYDIIKSNLNELISNKYLSNEYNCLVFASECQELFEEKAEKISKYKFCTRYNAYFNGEVLDKNLSLSTLNELRIKYPKLIHEQYTDPKLEEEYKNILKNNKEYKIEIRKLFRLGLEFFNDVDKNHPKTEELFEKCWLKGYDQGFEEISDLYSVFSILIK